MSAPEAAKAPEIGKLTKTFERKSEVLFCLTRVPESQVIYAGAADGRVYRYDLAEAEVKAKEKKDKLEPIAIEGHTSYVGGVALAAGGDVLVSGGWDRRLVFRDAKSHEPIKTHARAHGKWIRHVTASPDGATVATVADDMICRLWDAKSGKLVRELKAHEPRTPNHYPSMLFTCAFSRDGGHLATADKTGRVIVWDVKRGEIESEVAAPVMYTWDPRARRHSIGGVRSLALTDAGTLAIGGMGKVGNIDHLGGKARFELHDWANHKTIREHEGDKAKGLIERMAFGPDDAWVVAAGGDNKGFVTFIDTATGKAIREEQAPMHVHDFVLDESSSKIIAVGHERLVVWELTTA